MSSRGQVTIPKAMREALKMKPGSAVTLRIEGDKLVVEPFDAVAVFRRIAREGPSIDEVDPHAYEEEIEERWQRALAGAKEPKNEV